MAGSGKAREGCNVLALFLDARPAEQAAGDVVATVMGEGGSPSPLRHMLEKRSDSSFLPVLHEALVADGLDHAAATHVLDHAVNWPAVAVRRGLADPKRTRLLQAVLFEPAGGDPGHLVVLTATISTAKPPEVVDAAVTVLPVDLASHDDLAEVAALAEQWWSDYAIRAPTPPPGNAPRRLAWLGDPANSGYRDVGSGWTGRVTAASAVLGMSSLIVRSPGEAKAQAVHERTDVAFAVNGSAGWQLQTARLQAAGVPVLTGGQPGDPFDSLLACARDTLLRHGLNASRPAASNPRELAVGESVYHRKISESRGDHDLFDDGSASPCKHGAEGFVRWSGDKSLKGMSRRYSNFEPSMLHHCRKYPNCGMYCARRPKE